MTDFYISKTNRVYKALKILKMVKTRHAFQIDIVIKITVPKNGNHVNPTLNEFLFLPE